MKTKSFLLTVLVTIILTRIWAISLFYIFANNPTFIQSFVNDSIHHYQVGLLMILISILLQKILKFRFLAGIGLGIFLEEWPVFLNDLGLNTNNLYQTKFDFMLILGMVGLLYILFSIMSQKSSPKR